jgi:hypothetical protein
MAIEIQCYVCREKAQMRDVLGAGGTWTRVTSSDDTRYYCSKEPCQGAYIERRAEFPEAEGPTSFGDTIMSKVRGGDDKQA